MEGRVKHSITNIIFGVIEQVMTILLTFLTRTVFIKVLNDNLLGINGLFSNILSLLSIAELGFGTAIIYGMYKPIAKKDTKKVAALMNYYRKIYNLLALIVTIIGLALVPFLKYLVNVETEIDNLVLYYLIFLSDSVCSYLLANRTAIIEANQNAYIIKRYNTFFIILKNILQIVTLVLFKNFILYLFIQVFITFASNLYGAIIAKKKYPYAFEKVEIEKTEKKSLLENVKSMVVYKIGGVLLNHTDNILLSIIVGTVSVGYYSNYNIIIYSITRFINIIFNAIKASVGNLNAGEDKEKQLRIFYQIDFFSSWLYGFITVGIFVLINDLIAIWIGEKYLFSQSVVFAIVSGFYLLGIMSPIGTYRETIGLFKQTKYVFLVTAILNIILSIILGKIWGVFGIFIATSISRLLTNSWFEPHVLLKDYFQTSCKKYFMNKVKNILLMTLSCVLILLIIKYIKILFINSIVCFIIEIIITTVLTNIIFFISYHKKEEYKYFKELAWSFIKK